jgi:hypothetical protein
VYDVAHVTPDQIKDLRKHGQDRLANTIENAKTSYADFTRDGGRVLVTTSKGNGGEPVMIVTGKDFHPTADNKATIHTHYHGDNATVADPMGSKAGTNWRIREAIKNHPQMVFVLPESVVQWGKQQMDTPTTDTSYGASWGNVTSQAQTTQDALNAIGLTDAGKIGTQVVSVHSKGGSVVSQLMGLDASGSRLKADRLELYDSLYGSQGDVAAWGTSKGGAKAQVVYYHGENDARRAKVIENALGSRYTLVDVSKEPKFDDTKNPVYKDAQKNTHTRTKDWDDDNGKKHYAHPTVREHFDDWGSHYRTVGQHLGE